MTLHLKIWRQKDSKSSGGIEDYVLEGVSPDMSFLEMLDLLNERLIEQNADPVAFDHDCREGICGMCGVMINGLAHGPAELTTTCQLHMRKFQDQDTIVIEPWRSQAFPVLKDLMVDRSSFDRIMAAGGYVSVNTGSAPDANAIAVAKEKAEVAMDAAACNRLWCLCGSLSQCLGHAVCCGEGEPAVASSPGGAGKKSAGGRYGQKDGRIGSG